MIGLLKFGSLREFWVENESGNNNGSGFLLGYGYGWSTLLALLFIFLFHSAKRLFFSPERHVVRVPSSSTQAISSAPHASVNPQFRIPEIILDSDLKFLIENLDEKPIKNEKWENVIEKKSNLLSYVAKCCKPKVSFLVFDLPGIQSLLR
uniref:Uncharacterized protein LOC103327463 n=1 Tax=Rhizophora mucronata TaxID=61149 RepID=A0A2P2MQX8_RHIMU